jgi:hypothetical protein
MEVMIVVMVITILLEIAVPSFIRARSSSQRGTCISNLKHIDAAKEEWAMDTGAPQGAAVQMSDIAGVYLQGPAVGPVCPGGGAYNLHPVGTDPTCNAPGLHVLQ